LPPRHTFTRSERLKSRKIIKNLFAGEGKVISAYPVRLIYKQVEQPHQTAAPIQFAVSVPARNFPKAVHRNLLKRRIREAYRLHKHVLYNALQQLPHTQTPTVLAIMVIYLAKEILPYQTIEPKVHQCLNQLLKRLPELVVKQPD